MKQKMTELKGEIDNSTVTVEDFNTSFFSCDRTTKDIENLYNPLTNLNLNIFLYLTRAEYILFSSTHTTFSRIDHMLSHKRTFLPVDLFTIWYFFSALQTSFNIPYRVSLLTPYFLILCSSEDVFSVTSFSPVYNS